MECRVCLVDNVRMHSLWNTRLKGIYEKLSGVKLSIDNGRPNTICFICSSQLQKFGKFLDMVQEAEDIFTIRLLSGIQTSQKTRDDLKLYNLKPTATQSMSYIDTGEYVEPEVTVTIKEEPVDFEDSEEFGEEYLDSSPASEEILKDTIGSMETTLNLQCPPEDRPGVPRSIDPEERKPDLPPDLLPDLSKVSIKKEVQDEDITETFLRNFTMALETLPETDFKFVPINGKTGQREFKYFCSLCNYKGHTSRALGAHNKVHDPSHKYACQFCSHRFISEKKLAGHRNYCTVCSICGKRFSSNHGLRIHVRQHTGIQPYTCDKCGRGFYQKTNMQTHMRVHSRINQFPCQTCQKTFPFKTYLERHMLIHSESPLDTESFQRTVNCHKLHVQKKNKPVVCSVCGRILQSKNGLAIHMRQHTGERPFACEACDRVFTQKYNLLTHVERVHSGDELFTCKVCLVVFPFNSDLKRHLPSHKDEISARDFEVFQQKHIYTVHRKVGHLGYSPYACDMCKTRILSY